MLIKVDLKAVYRQENTIEIGAYRTLYKPPIVFCINIVL